ncbi:MAG: Rne/Rng family ribonuclease, partial [Chitinophagales bacterium]
MVNRELIVNSSPEGVEIALLEDKELVELHREKIGKEFRVGDVYLGKITKTISGLNAAFVNVGYKKDAFLHYLDLGANIRTLNRIVQSSIAGNFNDYNLNQLKFEKEIQKTGKIDEPLDRRFPVLVQVLKEPISTKGPRLTSEISLAGRYLVLMPLGSGVGVSKRVSTNDERKRLERLIESIKPKNFGVVVRTNAEGKSVADLHADLNSLLERWKGIIQNLKGLKPPAKVQGELKKTSSIIRDLLNDSFNKIIVNEPQLAKELEQYLEKIIPDRQGIVSHFDSKTTLFDKFSITRQIKSLFGKTVTMPGGSYLVIEHTEALHVIDVNSGYKVARKDDQETTALKVNMDAAKEVARQLRLRDIGGIIVVDFIDLKKIEHKKQLYQAMKDFMKNDRAKHAVLPLSKFGLIQITRERTRPEINITTTENCPSCGGTGQIQASILLIDEIEIKLKKLLELGYDFNLYTHPYIEAYINRGIPSKRMKWMWEYKTSVPVYANNDYHLTEYHFLDKDGVEI